MRGKRILSVGVLALAVAPVLRAQVRGSLSVVPVAGYTVNSGNWLDIDLGGGSRATLKPKGGVFVGLVAEYNLNKSLSIAAHATRTLGATQKMREVDTGTFAATIETDLATTTIGGMIVFRPLGRLPSGAPNKVYIELGGSYNIYSVSTGFTDINDRAAVDSVGFGYHTPAVMGGAGLSFPVGPRASLQVFGRAYYQMREYSSNVLDLINQGNPNPLVGKKTILLQFGLGLRVGR